MIPKNYSARYISKSACTLLGISCFLQNSDEFNIIQGEYLGLYSGHISSHSGFVQSFFDFIRLRIESISTERVYSREAIHG